MNSSISRSRASYHFTNRTLYEEWVEISRDCKHKEFDLGLYCSLNEGRCDEFSCPKLKEGPVSIDIGWGLSRSQIEDWLQII